MASERGAEVERQFLRYKIKEVTVNCVCIPMLENTEDNIQLITPYFLHQYKTTDQPLRMSSLTLKPASRALISLKEILL